MTKDDRVGVEEPRGRLSDVMDRASRGRRPGLIAQLRSRWALWRRPKTARVLIWVRLRGGGVNQKRVTIHRTAMRDMFKRLVDQIEIREARVYEEIYMHHKSYAEDFDAANIERDLEEFLAATRAKADAEQTAKKTEVA